jgi:MYXO-CTERM domain-containing protein
MECDLGDVRGADLGTVDALARASLNASRQGERLRLVNAPPDLQELIALVGLAGVLFGRRRREAEEREEPLGVEKRGEPDDPTV